MQKDTALEKEIFEPNFYQHTEPDTVFYGDSNMPMTIESPDQPSAPAQLLVDDGNGSERPLTQAEAQTLMGGGGIPDGINVPGYQRPGARPQQDQSYKAREQRAQQPQQRPQQPSHQPQQRPQKTQQATEQSSQTQQVKVQTSTEDLVPPTEMAMVDGEYHVFVDLAGVSKEELKILYDNGTLKIEGKRDSAIDALRKELKSSKNRKNIKEATTSVPSFLMGKFQYKYYFKRLIDETNISAKYTNGVLHVILPHRNKGEQVKIALM